MKNINIKWKEIKSENETLLSICVYGRKVGLENNLLRTCVYIPPSHSRYGKRAHFDDEISLSNSDYFQVVSGDFNAHTETLCDVAQVDDVRGDFPAEIDVSAVFRAAGWQVTRANEDCTADRSSSPTIRNW